jgi:hypothetical protein
MAKTTKQPPPPAQPAALNIDLRPAPEATQALTLREQANALIVSDRDSHTAALEFVRGAKQLKRAIEDHWSRITRSIDDLKRNMLTLKQQDLAPVEDALIRAGLVALTYENAERERQRVELERQRQENEARARREREAETARLEAQALEAEESSADLSAREQAFVMAYVSGIGARGDARVAAERAGYKDADKQAARLLATEKIQKAIFAKRQAIELREQAAAQQAKPLDVVAPKVESNLGKAAGVSTRLTYSGECLDFDALFDAVAAGRAPRSVLMVNGPELNAEARSLKESFEQAFPGCRLVKKQGLAG